MSPSPSPSPSPKSKSKPKSKPKVTTKPPPATPATRASVASPKPFARQATRPGAARQRVGKTAPKQLGLDWSVPALTAGVDEAGRGPLAGPVVAAAVILDPLAYIEGLDDSKKLTAAVRERLYDEIMAKALCCSIAEASVEEIETLNILHATMLAMTRAVEGLRLRPGKVLVDGNRLPVLKVHAEAVIGGDATVAAIAAASILAKVHRDRLCVELHASHPNYGFDVHKGYSTPSHLSALRTHGASPVHRRGFAPVRLALENARSGPIAFSLDASPMNAASSDPADQDDLIGPDLIDAAFAGERQRAASTRAAAAESLGSLATPAPLLASSHVERPASADARTAPDAGEVQ